MSQTEIMNSADAKKVIELLDKEFDSHDFIQKYMKHFSASYGLLLEKYDNTTTTNSQIGKYLSANADKLNIEQIGKTKSPNVLGNESDNAQWRKLNYLDGMTKTNMDDEKIADEPVDISEESQDTDLEDNQPRRHSSVGDNPAEAVLSFFSYAILILGIVTSVLIGGFMIFDDFEWDNKIGWIVIIGGILASFIIWAILMVLINISNNIRQIKHELYYMEYLLEEED